jgi:hypothetical protein
MGKGLFNERLSLDVLGQRFWSSPSKHSDQAYDYSRRCKTSRSITESYPAVHPSITSRSHWLFVVNWHISLYLVKRISANEERIAYGIWHKQS